MKPILLCIVTSIVLSVLGGCASRKTKSSARLYEGDSSPSIKMFDEKPGSRLNPM